MNQNTGNQVISFPYDTPDSIKLALTLAVSTRFCKIISDVSVINTKFAKYFVIESIISAPREGVFEKALPRYRVKFLIPEKFPYEVVHTVPLDPPLKWYPHQTGEWPDEVIANAICPPNINDIYTDQLLLPYIHHAYSWITDALAGNLNLPGTKYEFPLLLSGEETTTVYVEGGKELFNWVVATEYGYAYVKQVEKPMETLRVETVHKNDSNFKKSNIKPNVFGDEDKNNAWVAWFYAGDPIVEYPHRPPIYFHDFSQVAMMNFFKALKNLRFPRFGIVLVAFSIPEKWGEESNTIVWKAFKFDGVSNSSFDSYDPYSFKSIPEIQMLELRDYFETHKKIRWIQTIDVSKESIQARASIESQTLKNMKIAHLGIGALGSPMSKAIMKLAPKEYYLIDKEFLEPGNLVRHEASCKMVGYPKSLVTELSPSPFSDSEAFWILTDYLQGKEPLSTILKQSELIIDTTASSAVHFKLIQEYNSKMMAIGYIKPGPDFGVLILRKANSLITFEQAQEHLLKEIDQETLKAYKSIDEEKKSLVWPEPGCYHPTFQASFHRIRLMADTFLTTIFDWLSLEKQDDVVTLFKQEQEPNTLGIQTRIVKQIIFE